MILHSFPASSTRWTTISFPSTLHLYPILDVLLAKVPEAWRPEIRLGLQEALVNAAKHGNHLDPLKSVSIRFCTSAEVYCWVIMDQGSGFCTNAYQPPALGGMEDLFSPEAPLPANPIAFESDLERDCGRGLFILDCIFDQVEWSEDGKVLTLVKQVHPEKTWRGGLPTFAGFQMLWRNASAPEKEPWSDKSSVGTSV